MVLLVKDIMLTEVVSFSPGLSIDVLEQKLLNDQIGGAPVIEKGEVIGVVCRSDIVKRLAIEQVNAVMVYDFYESPAYINKDGMDVNVIASLVGHRIEHMKVRDIMTRSIISVSPTQPLSEAADLMLEKKIHRLLVIEDNKLVGVISATDFARLYSNQDPVSRPH